MPITTPAFVLIHGGDCTSACWDDLLPLLGTRSIAVDLPGRGRHPADLTQLRLRDWADSVVADMDAAGIERAICVGHSLGGATLAELALHHPGRLLGLAFVACPFPGQGGTIAEACSDQVAAMFSQWHDAGLRIVEQPSREQAVALFGPDLDATQIDRMCAQLVPESLSVFLEPRDLSGLAKVPTLYVKLGRDQASPPDVQDRAIAHIRPSQVADIDAGHMAMYTQPVELANALTSWAATL